MSWRGRDVALLGGAAFTALLAWRAPARAAAQRSERTGDARGPPVDLFKVPPLSAAERSALDAVCKAPWPPAVGCLCASQAEVDAVVKLRDALLRRGVRSQFASQSVDDVRHLLCFARARGLDVSKAETMWVRAHEWRESRRGFVDGLTAGYVQPAALERCGAGGVYGVDLNGAPVLYNPVGRLDPPRLFETVSVRDWVDAELAKSEGLQAVLDRRSIEDAQPHAAFTVVVDLAGLGWRHYFQPAFDAFAASAQQMDDYYPERTKVILVVNAPAIFTLIWCVESLARASACACVRARLR